MAYGTLNAGAITPGSGNTLTISETVSFTGGVTGTTVDATTDFTVGGTVITDNTITDDGTLVIAASTATSFSDGNITNVGDIALDTISSDAGTSIGVTLGTDAGDDFNVGSGKLVVEGDTGSVFIGTDDNDKTSNGFRVENGIANTSRGSTGNLFLFYDTASGASIGNIKNANGSSVAYNTTSDYRLKENVVAMSGSIDRLKLLKPSRFNFIVNPDNSVDGFLAHEAQAVVPESVSGAKDAMTEAVLYVEGDELPTGKSIGDVKTASVPDMQGIDQSKLVPLLVSALQEAIARIETLESA